MEEEVKQLYAEYQSIFSQYQLAKSIEMNYKECEGYMVRMAKLYQNNQKALNNGQFGNQKLIKNQLGLEVMLGIKDSYELLRC